MVLERTGFRYEGRTRGSYWVGEEVSDDLIYGMTVDDWQAWQDRPTGPPEDVALVLTLPLADKEDVDVMRHDDELFVTVDTYRRSLVLPDSLRRRTVRRAKLENGELRVVFTLEDR